MRQQLLLPELIFSTFIQPYDDSSIISGHFSSSSMHFGHVAVGPFQYMLASAW